MNDLVNFCISPIDKVCYSIDKMILLCSYYCADNDVSLPRCHVIGLMYVCMTDDCQIKCRI